MCSSRWMGVTTRRDARGVDPWNHGCRALGVNLGTCRQNTGVDRDQLDTILGLAAEQRFAEPGLAIDLHENVWNLGRSNAIVQDALGLSLQLLFLLLELFLDVRKAHGSRGIDRQQPLVERLGNIGDARLQQGQLLAQYLFDIQFKAQRLAARADALEATNREMQARAEQAAGAENAVRAQLRAAEDELACAKTEADTVRGVLDRLSPSGAPAPGRSTKSRKT